MTTLPAPRPSWEVPHSLGSILWREARRSYEVRLRERPREPQRSTYVPGDRTPATYERAERELARRITASGRGERETDRTLTVGAWLDQWLELQLAQKPRTIDAYRARVDLYMKPRELGLARHKLHDLEPADVARWIRKLQEPRTLKPKGERKLTDPRKATLSIGTIDAAFRVLDDALGDAWSMGKAPRNACRGVDVARPDTLVEPPTLEELELLFAALAGDEYLPIFALMRETGARLGEVLGLERRHVDLAARTITYSRQRANRRGAELGSLKGARHAARRTVAIPEYLAELLEHVPARVGTPLLFSTATGRPLDQRNVLRHFDAACKRAGIAPDVHADLAKYRPHDLRHAFATSLIRAGVAEPIVAAWLGHNGTAMLKRYAHVRPRQDGGAAYRRLVDVWGEDLELAFGIRGLSAAARHEAERLRDESREELLRLRSAASR